MKLLFSFFALLSLAAFAADHPVKIENPYAYMTTPVQKNGAVFMEITNTLEHDDKVIKAESSVSETVELHTHIMDGGIMMMREVENYELAAGEVTTLEPSGKHVMLIGLHEPLESGRTFPLTLYFEKAAPKTIDVRIIRPGEEP